jgi:hypothetical protein
VIEYLPSKYEDLSSNPSTAKKKEKRIYSKHYMNSKEMILSPSRIDKTKLLMSSCLWMVSNS